MEEKKTWLAVYTKPRWEKKVHERLVDKGIHAYCPLNKVRKQWSDRVKLVEEPLFKSYVFVQVGPKEQAAVRLVDGVLNFVYWLGKPAIIKDAEIEAIRRFLDEFEDVRAEPVDLQPNARVLIKAGVLMDRQATVRRVLQHTVELLVETLGYKLVAQVDKAKVVPIAPATE